MSRRPSPRSAPAPGPRAKRPKGTAESGRGPAAGPAPAHLRRATSARNPALALVRALAAKKVRRERRLFVAEGEDLIDAALARGIRPAALLVDEERVAGDDPRLVATADVAERYAVTSELMARVSELAAPPRMLAVLPQPGPHSFRTVPFPPGLALYLTAVSDPGNVGTLVRSAAALGCDWLALGPGSADPFHPRAVRAAMGATLALPLLEGVTGADLATREGFRVVSAVAAGGVPPWEADLRGPLVLALGAERAGVGGALDDLERAGRVLEVTIPQAPGTDSLNVAAAGAILLAEARRQRAVER